MRFQLNFILFYVQKDYTMNTSFPTNSFHVSPGSYVTVIYKEEWWLAFVLSGPNNDSEFRLDFLHPKGRPNVCKQSFKFIEEGDYAEVHIDDIVAPVEARLASARSDFYYLDEKNCEKAYMSLLSRTE